MCKSNHFLKEKNEKREEKRSTKWGAETGYHASALRCHFNGDITPSITSFQPLNYIAVAKNVTIDVQGVLVYAISRLGQPNYKSK